MASLRQRPRFTDQQLQANLREQAETLLQAGVDFLLAESTGTNANRKWMSDACRATGAPIWVGFKCHRDANDGTVKTGYLPDDQFSDVLEDVMSHGSALLSVFHTGIDDVTAALEIAQQEWPGPLGADPDAERTDYMTVARDQTVENRYSPEQFAAQARKWVEMGVQLVGGCCGYGPRYIRSLRDALPQKIAASRRAIATP
jgi:S-methylmethionine-dependent homocysteine/selenocysteine methylase